ncbi:MAG: hypothetical protein AAFP19_06100 [Bacteroidota bacterium]
MKTKKLVQTFSLLLVLFFSLSSCQEDQAKYYYQKAYILEEEERYAEAIQMHDKAIAINPQFEIAYLDRAIDKSLLEDFEGAITDLDTLLQIQPNAIEAYVWRAEYNRMLERYSAALKDAEQAFNLKKPIHPDGYLVDSFSEEEAAKADPVNGKPYYDVELEYVLYERGLASYRSGYMERAYEDISYCISKDLNPVLSRLIRGEILLHQGKIEKACEDLFFASSKGNTAAAALTMEYCYKNTQ